MANRINVKQIAFALATIGLPAGFFGTSYAQEPIAPPVAMERHQAEGRRFPGVSNPPRNRAVPIIDPIQAAAITEERCTFRGTFKSEAMFYGKELRARVVDYQTRQPIEGALVLAVWGTRKVNGENLRPGTKGIVHAIEVLTDRDGHFTTPAWGPLPVIRDYGIKLNWWDGRAESFVRANPYLTIFKEGYGTRSGEPDARDDLAKTGLPKDWRIGTSVLTAGVAGASEYEGKEIAIGRYSPLENRDLNNHRKLAFEIDHILDDLSRADACAWERFPNSISNAWKWVKLDRKFLMSGASAQVFSEPLFCDAFRGANGCNSFTKFVEELK